MTHPRSSAILLLAFGFIGCECEGTPEAPKPAGQVATTTSEAPSARAPQPPLELPQRLVAGDTTIEIFAVRWDAPEAKERVEVHARELPPHGELEYRVQDLAGHPIAATRISSLDEGTFRWELPATRSPLDLDVVVERELTPARADTRLSLPVPAVGSADDQGWRKPIPGGDLVVKRLEAKENDGFRSLVIELALVFEGEAPALPEGLDFDDLWGTTPPEKSSNCSWAQPLERTCRLQFETWPDGEIELYVLADPKAWPTLQHRLAFRGLPVAPYAEDRPEAPE